MSVNITSGKLWTAGLIATIAALVGCTSKTDVSATGSAPAQYSHVFVSISEVWFNTDSNATPDDTTWAKYPLKTPVTIDLATSMTGTMNSVLSGLNVPIGTYTQLRLIPVDASATLLSSASALGATWNSEVDYTDSSGTAHQVVLELLNPDKGIGVSTSLQVKGNTSAAFASASSSDSSTDSTSDTTSDGTSESTTSSTTNNNLSIALNLNGTTDIVPFLYSTVTGMVLNPHITAFDAAAVGGISGTLDVTGLSGITGTGNTAYTNIQVTAETLSTDGTRHVAVNSAPVSSSGTFTLFPLSTNSSSPTSYDLVIHGPGIAPIIIKGISVTVGDTSSLVSVGTVVPTAASSFPVNLASTTTPLPPGAMVGFYQTVPTSNEVPYLIDGFVLDPFNFNFATDQSLSSGQLQYATFTSGSAVTLTSADPSEGHGTYRVAGTAPMFTDGVLTTLITGPSSSTTTAMLVNPGALSAASGAALDVTTVTISQTTAKKYDKGEIIFSHDGQVVATASLDAILQQTSNTNGVLTVNGLPSGSTSGVYDAAIYYVSVRTWNSTNPSNTVNRETYPTPLDLRNGSTLTTYSLNID